MAGLFQRLLDFVDVILVGYLHGNDPDVVLARQLKHPGQAARAVPLERVGVGARLVGAHTGALLAIVLQRAEGFLNMGWVVYGA